MNAQEITAELEKRLREMLLASVESPALAAPEALTVHCIEFTVKPDPEDLEEIRELLSQQTGRPGSRQADGCPDTKGAHDERDCT